MIHCNTLLAVAALTGKIDDRVTQSFRTEKYILE